MPLILMVHSLLGIALFLFSTLSALSSAETKSTSHPDSCSLHHAKQKLGFFCVGEVSEQHDEEQRRRESSTFLCTTSPVAAPLDVWVRLASRVISVESGLAAPDLASVQVRGPPRG